jgi:hydroxyacylglutathione hydrolase
MKLIPLPAFADNYIWMLHDESRALVVDPGDPQPVFEALQRLGVKLEAILVTHHHPDHTGGVKALRESTGAAVFGPARETIPEPLTRLQDHDLVMALGLSFKVIDIPGHTAGHIAYFCESNEGSPLLFCGDTLFSGGCGRLFEGTPAQMLASLDRLAALPEATRVCCTHEYTLSNLKFALAVDPHNEALIRYMESAQALRDNGQPTLPSSLALELQINPFLRSRLPALIRAAQSFDEKAHDEVSHFAALRQWKNQF